MKKYTVVFSNEARKDLKKLDKPTASLIVGWIRKNLEGCDNPRIHGKGLTGNRSKGWRYRIGDYRLICDIQDNKILIYVLTVGHRKEEVYRIKR